MSTVRADRREQDSPIEAESLEERLLLAATVDLHLVSQWGGEVNAAAMAGGFAYVCRGPALDILDVSDPKHPALAGSILLSGISTGIAFSGGKAYITEGTAGLEIIDVGTPTAPVRLGGYDTSGNACAVAVSGSKVLIADGESGLVILDVSNPASPALVSTYNRDWVTDVVVGGQVAYLSAGLGLQIVDISDPAAPAFLSEYATWSQVEGVCLSGNLAYVIQREFGLWIIDVANPASPVYVGFTEEVGGGIGVAVVGQTAYFCSAQGIAAMDVSNPAVPVFGDFFITRGAPVGLVVSGDTACVFEGSFGLELVQLQYSPVYLRGSYDTPGAVYDLFMSGNIAYVADYDGGFMILDFSDPFKPTPLGCRDMNFDAYHVMASGTRAYVSDSRGDINVFDVTNPADPVLLANYDSPGFINSFFIVGTIAYLATSAGLQIVDLADPALPVTLGTYNASSNQAEIFVSGNRAYVASNLTFQVVDVSIPAAPSLLGGCGLRGSAVGVCVSGNLAYVAAVDYGLQIIDVSDPAAPAVCGELRTPEATDVAIAGSVALLCAGYSGMVAVDVTDPSAPFSMGTFETPDASAVFAANGLAYLSADFGVLKIIDYQSGRTPQPLGSYDKCAVTNDVTIAGGLAYLANERGGSAILDVSDPNAPERLSSLYWNAEDVFVSGDGTYLAGYHLQAFDTSNPVQPVYMGACYAIAAKEAFVVGNRGYVVGGCGLEIVSISSFSPMYPPLGYYSPPAYPYGVFVSGNFAYVADDTAGLLIIDVSNPAAPVKVGQYDTAGRAQDVVVIGNIAYVADGAAGLQIIDVSNPAAPVRLGGCDTPWFAQGVYVAGGLAYVADDFAGVQIINVSNSAAPVLVGSFDTLGRAANVEVAGNFVYVADGEGGIVILSTKNAPSSIGLSPASVTENRPLGTVVGNFSTVDGDAGDTFTYTLVSGYGDDDNASFTIQNNTLKTNASFDHEAADVCSIRVRSTDSFGLSVEKIFTISVTDINERPVIANQTLDVPENSTVGSAVGVVAADDPDAGQRLSYSIMAGNTGGTFAINASTGSITVANAALLNFETPITFALTVVVTDNGSPTLSGTGVVTINVTDVNEAPTQITLSAGTLQENSPVGTLVAAVSGTDPDAGQSATLVFSLPAGHGDNDLFSIDPATRQLKTASSLDYETKSTYSVKIRATDAGTPVLTFDKVFTVTLTNVNERPSDISLTASSVPENQPVGTAIGTISGTDPDAGQSATLAFSLFGGYEDSGLFTIDPATRRLKTAAVFDYEARSSYNVKIRATDAGGLTYDEVFTVLVADVNEQPAMGAQTFGPVAENSPAGAIVGEVLASDPDAGQSLSYSIIAGNTGNAFSIDPTTGQLSVATSAALNYETASSIVLTVRVADSGTPSLSSSAAVTVNLTDVNEAPTGINLSNDGVAEHQPSGTVVGVLAGIDPDAGQSAALTLSLVEGYGDDGLFSFDPVTKELRTAAVFDHEACESYNIKVLTADGAGLTCEAEFTVLVDDVNERPVAADQSFGPIIETCPNGTIVGTVTASDPDAGDILSYAITSGNADGAFSIDPLSGRITVTASSELDFETQARRVLNVRVSDDGSPALFQEVTITVDLADGNDAPTAVAQSVVVGDDAGVTVTLSASDVDSPLALLQYNLLASPAHGTLTPLGGNSFRYEVGRGYDGNDSFTFSATDSSGLTSEPAEIAISGGVMKQFSATGKLPFIAGNGDAGLITISRGFGSVFFGHSGSCDVGRIFLDGTTSKSSLRILTQSRVAMAGVRGGIDSSGPLASISATKAIVSGPIRIGAGAAYTSVKLGRAVGASLVSASPVKLLSASEWTVGSGSGSTLVQAPLLKKLSIKGLFAGDLDVDVFGGGSVGSMSGSSMDVAASAGKFKVAGDMLDSRWSVRGDLGKFTVGGTARDSVIRSGGTMLSVSVGASQGSDFLAAVGAITGRTPDKVADFANPAASIKSFVVKGLKGAPASQRFFADSNLASANIGKVRLLNGDFAADGIYLASSGTVNTIKHTDKSNGLESWTYPPRPGVVFAQPGLIHVL